MPNILDTICNYKAIEVKAKKSILSLSSLKQQAFNLSHKSNFLNAIESKSKLKKTSIIAELKKASPSKGLIKKDFSVENIAKSYKEAGATCLSVLTDKKFFQGDDGFIKIAKEKTNLPVLRKDFFIDEYMIYEAKVLGADAILLIMACLSDEQATKFEGIAFMLGLDVLVEVHNMNELSRALKLKTRLIGINNRNLKTMKVDIMTSINLSKYLPKDRIVVCESGIKNRDHINFMKSKNIHAFLIGESLMLQNDIKYALKKLL